MTNCLTKAKEPIAADGAKPQVTCHPRPEQCAPSSAPRAVRPEQCAPSRIRTCGLLLRSNPAVDAVAIYDDAGQVRTGMRCCSPSYLVIALGDIGRTTATEDAAWIVSQAGASGRLIVLGNQALPAGPVGSHSAVSPEHHVAAVRRLPFATSFLYARACTLTTAVSAVSAVSDRTGAIPLRTGARICVTRSDQPDARTAEDAVSAHSYVLLRVIIVAR